MGKTYKQAGPVFFAGLILVIVGAVTVLMFQPGPKSAGGIFSGLNLKDLSLVLTFVAMTGLAWGAYGPVLHKGQMAMQGSRLRPLLCVGLAYFLIAVLVPAALIALWQEPGGFKPVGTLWSLGGGAAGAVGALGIIMAFNSGGKPIYVMPLVFGLAPVINTFASILSDGSRGQIGPLFYAGLLLVVAGAVTVLIFAPKAHPQAVNQHAPPAKETGKGLASLPLMSDDEAMRRIDTLAEPRVDGARVSQHSDEAIEDDGTAGDPPRFVRLSPGDRRSVARAERERRI